jgi:hypothetical protein
MNGSLSKHYESRALTAPMSSSRVPYKLTFASSRQWTHTPLVSPLIMESSRVFDQHAQIQCLPCRSHDSILAHLLEFLLPAVKILSILSATEAEILPVAIHYRPFTALHYSYLDLPHMIHNSALLSMACNVPSLASLLQTVTLTCDTDTCARIFAATIR